MVKILSKKTCIASDFSKIDEQLLIRSSKAGNRGLTWSELEPLGRAIEGIPEGNSLLIIWS